MQTVILGSSFYAAGRVLSDSDVVVIGRGSSVGDEWCYSHRACAGGYAASTDTGRAVQAELCGLGLASPDANAMALSVLLYGRLSAIPERFMLWTELESVAKIAGGYELTLYTVSGRETVRCRELVDNTATALTRPDWGRTNVSGKRLNMLVEDTTGNSAPLEGFDGLSVHPGRTAQERVVALTVSPETELAAGRAELLARWQRRPAAFESWRIATFGAEFDYDLVCDLHILDEDWVFMNPLAFESPLAAFDAGVAGGAC